MQIIIEPHELERFRKKANITQKELAKLCRVSQSFIARLERGSIDPTYSKIKLISETLLPRVFSNAKKVKDIMTKNVIYARRDESIKEVANKMAQRGISQLPVVEGDRVIGSITEQAIIARMAKEVNEKAVSKEKVEDLMEPPFPIVPEDTPVELLFFLLSYYQAVLVSSGGKVCGIVTKADLLQNM